MARKEIGPAWDRDARNAMNHNDKELYEGMDRAAQKAIEEIGGEFEAFKVEQAEDFAAFKAKNDTRFLDAVATVSERDSKYPKPANGDTVRVTGEAAYYRYEDGQGWVKTDQYNPTAIDQVNQQLADTAKKSDVNARGSYMDILAPSGGTRFIAHMGMSGLAPESTVVSIEVASELGMWASEADAQLTSDGEWVIMHDYTVDRTTNGTGKVSNLTLAEIKSLTIDGGNNISYYPNLKVPTLKEHLLACKKYSITPCIEIKTETYEPTYTEEEYDYFVDIIRGCGLESNIIIQGSEPICTQIRKRSRVITLMLFNNIANLTTWAGNYIKESGNMILNTDKSYITKKEDVELAHSMGIPVSVFVVDDEGESQKLSNWGVDFIMTNILSGGVRH